MIRCPSCGSENPDRNRFCGSCAGALLSSSVTEAVGPVVADQPPDPGLVDEGRFPPGTVLARRYRIVERIGRGGMGEVYRANDLKLAQHVALKFLPPGLIHDPRALSRFQNEARLALQVSHPNKAVNISEYLSLSHWDY